MQQKAGRVYVAGMTREVTFEPVTGTVNDKIDSAYKTKYKASQYMNPMIGDRARSATVKIKPKG